MEQCNESCEHKAKSDRRIAFLADRMAVLMMDLVRRDFEFGKFCHDEFFTNEIAGYLRHGKEYAVCIDFVRMMIKRDDRRFNDEMEMAKAQSEEGPEQGLQPPLPSGEEDTTEAGGGG